MLQPKRILLAGLGVATLTTSVFFTGCKPKSDNSAETAASPGRTAPANQPEAFTGQLTEIAGIQGIYTLRHPKLIFAELDTLMAAVPEASMIRMFFGGLAPYGHPEFSELAAGSNIGIAVLEITKEELAAQKPTIVAFAKLKKGGKIWNALGQTGLALKTDGDWTWIAKDEADFAKVTAPAAVFAHIEQPQAEELRAWGRVSPALLDAAKTPVFEKLKTSIEKRPADEQAAIVAYADVLWGYLSQLHSAGGSLDLNDDGLVIAYDGQFTPDSASGRYLRYPAGPSPKIAQSVPADGLMSAIVRQNVTGQTEFVNGLLDALIAVDYPEGKKALTDAKGGFNAFAKGSDGSGVMTMSMGMPKGDEVPEVAMLGINPGNYTEADVFSFYETTLDVSKRFTDAMLSSAASLNPGAPAPTVSQELNENAFEIDGVRFGSVVTTVTIKGEEDAEDQTTTTAQYFGVVGGNLVYGTDEAALRAKLPAIAANRAVDNPVNLTFADGEVMVGAVHGENIVSMVAASLSLDTTDADVQAQLASFKKGFVAAGPVEMAFSAQQAKAAVTVSIPYKFIAQGVRFGQFAAAYSVASMENESAPSGEEEVMTGQE